MYVKGAMLAPSNTNGSPEVTHHRVPRVGTQHLVLIGTPVSSRRNDRWTAITKWGALTVLATAVLGGTFWKAGSTQRELGALSASERTALYTRTFETLRSTCAHPNGPELRDLCGAQANLIVLFPECDGACRAVASRATPHPTR
jgi:hypothetical protein